MWHFFMNTIIAIFQLKHRKRLVLRFSGLSCLYLQLIERDIAKFVQILIHLILFNKLKLSFFLRSIFKKIYKEGIYIVYI